MLEATKKAIRKSASIRQVERKWNWTARFYNRLPTLKTALLPLSFSYRIFSYLLLIAQMSSFDKNSNLSVI
ncbi:hypothetical protein, partial [Treponema sp. UBA6852]|uniref:hypothetical protein n=1 Tax=Treponema sp. UBA6852 TaxID=1947744 RepID=UPI0025E53126